MITYVDKKALDVNPEISQSNKWTSDDANEVKEVVNKLYTICGLTQNTYSSLKTYSVDDRTIYQNALYKCTTPITTPEEWNESHWELIPIIKM